jgi:branched-chain amino acid transport system substrate-binding protein
MNRFIKKLSFIITPLLLAGLMGCGNDSTSVSGDPSPAAANDGEAVTIGFTGPLSGGAAYYGKNALSGLELAIEEINGSGGFEVDGTAYHLNLVALDDKYQPSEAAMNAKRLVQESGAPIIFTPHSGGTLALSEFNQQDNFLIGAYTSEPSVVEKGNELLLRIPPAYDGYFEPFATHLMENYGKKLAIATGNHAYGKAWAESFKQKWIEMGGEVVAENLLDYNKDTDFFSGISDVVSKKPDAMLIGGASAPTAIVAQQARELGFKGGFAFIDQAKMDEMVDILGNYDVIEGSVGTRPLTIIDRPVVKEFIENYTKKYGKAPGSEAAYHYQTVFVLIEAMKQAKSTSDATAIRAQLDAAFKSIPDQLLYEVDGVLDNGSSESPPAVGVVENGQPVEKK